MANRYLLEVGMEELPASYSKLAIEQFKNAFEKLLSENSYKDFGVNVYTTPRRIATIVDNIIENESIEKEEIKGPSKAISFDQDGNPSKALQGFLKSKGLSLDDIFYKDMGGTEYVFASVERKSLSFTELIEANAESIIRKIVFPKSMKWGGRDLRFARPIRWIVSLYNDKVVKFNLENIRVSNLTNGHRFLSKKDIEIPDAHDYMKLMEDNHVIVDNEERKAKIRLESERLAKSVGGSLQDDEAIIDQVTNLVEYPTPLLGTIKDQYLELPDEVVITPMKDHLRYFPVVDSKNRLMNHFITVRNGDDKYLDIVRKGNEKVLAARLEDAKFFFNEDRKKDLEEYVNDLKTIVFQDKLGTLYDKTLRNIKLAEKICDDLNVGDETLETTKRAAYLSKADLATKLVVEFTELQGIMGKIYANLSGEPIGVQEAIYEHYLPRFAQDSLPTTTAGVVLAMADKLDTISGLFAIGTKPSGSQDPFGIRRASLGIINIVLEKSLDISIDSLVEETLYNYVKINELKFDYDEVKKTVLDYIETRFVGILQDSNYDANLIRAVINKHKDLNLLSIKQILSKLDGIKDSEDFEDAVAAFRRIYQISKGKEFEKVEPNQDIMEESERELFNLYTELKAKDENIQDMDIVDAIKVLATYKDSIDKFLDTTMVLVDNKLIKNNRLSLISLILAEFNSVLDFKEIEEI
jgi:glycyl-tRNA synthetase beta chain